MLDRRRLHAAQIVVSRNPYRMLVRIPPYRTIEIKAKKTTSMA
jgi:hypothetical protein